MSFCVQSPSTDSHIEFDNLCDPNDDSRMTRTKTGRYRKRSRPITYRLRVDLDGARPPIWRRLDVASDLTLAELHLVIQAAFDWGGHHLHRFISGDRWTGEQFVTEFELDEEEDEATLESVIRIDQLLAQPCDRLFYWYDYGDDWWHTIKLERTEGRADGDPPAKLVTGRRDAPPDDCGGIWGYANLLEVLGDSTHPEHAELSEWFESMTGVTDSRAYDPNDIDLDGLADDIRGVLAERQT